MIVMEYLFTSIIVMEYDRITEWKDSHICMDNVLSEEMIFIFTYTLFLTERVHENFAMPSLSTLFQDHCSDSVLKPFGLDL